MDKIKSFEEVKNVVEKWWSALQHERKCNSTNMVSKVVNHSSEDVQKEVRKMISQEIKTVIQNCRQSKDLNDIRKACNALNGCFDNFTHAVDSIRHSFIEVISFINFSITECHNKLLVKCGSKNFTLMVLELLHSLSRILILVLKLKRTFKVERGKRIVEDVKQNEISEFESVALKQLLPGLTSKIASLLLMDDVLIDTKNNLVMAGILIKEILMPDEQALIQYHKKFINTIPSELSDENSKLNIIKFLMCSAIINSWSVNIIDPDSTFIYLRFFISLCENYSSETPIILNTSRTLLLLIKHDCFKEFIDIDDKEKVYQTINLLLSCVFMLLEHPIACVRHSAKDFLHLLSVHSSLQPIIITSVFKLPKDKRSYFISIAALANEVGSRVLIEKNPSLPKQLLDALHDPTIVSHVSFALENMILRDDLAEKDFSKWCETWIVPLLVSLMNVLPIIAADIDKLLEKAFKKYPESVIYITNKWRHPTSGEELRYVITALKIIHKQGFKMKTNSQFSSFDEREESNRNENNSGLPEKKWNNLISEKLLEHCLHQRDDEIRMSAFSLIIEAHKTTKIYTEKDFKFIMYFLKYNLNNQQPSTRQKVLGLVRKMLVRFSDSKSVLLKHLKTKPENLSTNVLYEEFLESLVEFCFDNIFIGCNFNRLNTVLNILSLCFDNVKDMSFNSMKTNYYWNKFLIALDSSYEENKQLAVVLCEKLNYDLLESNGLEKAKFLYEKAFNLCGHMEPPDVLTGSYLLQALTKLPSSKILLTKYFIQDRIIDDVNFYCIQILLKKLKEQVAMAKLDLMTSSTCGPMYGTLFAIRLIFRNVDFSGDCVEDKTFLNEWGKVLNELLNVCFEMTQIVGCVVNSSSPEGHLPMDFQTDFENLLSLNDSEVIATEESNGIPETATKVSSKETASLITEIYENLINKFIKLENAINSSDFDAYETIRSLKCLCRENKVLIFKLKFVTGEIKDRLNEERISLDKLNQLQEKLEVYLEKLDKTNSVVEWPATAQVLLLCAWRSIKESCLYFGDLVSKLPLETAVKLGLLTPNMINRVGVELKHLLCEIKHRGAFEHAYIGFTHLVNSLWKCSDKNLSNLPRKWLEEIGEELETPLKDQKMKLCATRRSAGLPFLVQAIICSEITSIKSPTPSSLHYIMKCLLGIVENGVLENSESKIHALNVLRALFKDAQLGEHIASYVSRALMVAIRGSRASTWSERNSSSLLFSSLMIRIFGVARSRDEISKKNRMTSRTFFQRYSELYDFLLSEMELAYLKDNHEEGLFPKPSLYLVLLVLGRLYPPPTEDSENIDLSDFLPYINMSRRNPILKIRELGARALVSLIPPDRLVYELNDRFLQLSRKVGLTQNERHGILLQIRALLMESGGIVENLIKGSFEENKISWLESTKWMLRMEDDKSRDGESSEQVSFITLTTYVKVLHILFKNYSFLRGEVFELILKAEQFEKMIFTMIFERNAIPGIYLFLESFFILKLDVLSYFWFDSNDSRSREKFFELIMFTLNCKVSEVQSIPLTVLYSCLRDDFNDIEDDNFSGTYGARIEDLLIYKRKDYVENIEKEILSNSELLKCVVNQLNELNPEYFESKTVLRLWVGTVTSLVMKGIVSIRHSDESDSFCSLRIESVKDFLGSGDKELSTNALMCFSIYLLEEISAKKKEGKADEECSILSNILDEYSLPEGDVKERLAVAKIINRCFENLIDKNMVVDPMITKIWMIPFKLLADEISGIRFVAEEFVHKMQAYNTKEIPLEKLLIKMSTLDWPHLPLVTLKAQECLLDLFINFLGCDNLLYLVIQMIVMALSSLCDVGYTETSYKDEFGVFEKGNPNPYCEVLALSDLMSSKLSELKKLTDLEALLRTPLDLSSKDFISKSLNLSESLPDTLLGIIDAITNLVNERGKSKKEFSTPQVQIKNLRSALELPEINDL